MESKEREYHRKSQIYAYIATGKATERVLGFNTGSEWKPLVFDTHKEAQAFKHFAERVTVEEGERVRLVIYTRRIILENLK